MTRYLSIVVALAGAVACAPQETPAARAVPAAADRVLRVCADPNNLPFSNDRGEGFENRIAELVASALHKRVAYTWWAQRRGFLRQTLNARQCDVVMGMPSSVELALATRPYYRSTYVFVTRHDRRLALAGFDDPRLRRLHIGVQLIGDDGANAPPAHALSRRGIVSNVTGYLVFGDYRQPSPPSRIIRAVSDREIDVAVAWGPLAGYFSARQPVPLDVTPVSPEIDLPFLPFVFDIAMAVRRGDEALRSALDAVIVERRAALDRILEEYHVPRVDTDVPGSSGVTE